MGKPRRSKRTVRLENLWFLIVEDDPLVVRVWIRLLKHFGVNKGNILHARDIDEAQRMLGVLNFNCIIIDGLNGDGPKLTEWLKNEQAMLGEPLIVACSSEGPMMDQMKEHGVGMEIAKPFKPEVVEELIDKLVPPEEEEEPQA